MSEDNEIWKRLHTKFKPFDEFYEVSNHGRIRSIDRTVHYINGQSGKTVERSYKGRILKPRLNRHGYLVVNLSHAEKSAARTVRLHAAVAYTFIPVPEDLKDEEKLEINHIDANKINNNANNLEFCTHRQNLIHASKTGLLKGKNRGIILNFEIAENIRDIYAKNAANACQIAKLYGVSPQNINHIINNRTWKKDSRPKRKSISKPVKPISEQFLTF